MKLTYFSALMALAVVGCDDRPPKPTDCSDPAYSNLPSCGGREIPEGLTPPDIYNRGTPETATDSPPDLQNKPDAIRERNAEKDLEKRKLACETESTPEKRNKCLERLDF